MNDKLYCYENTNVLKNKYDIKNPELLDKIESESVGNRMLSILSHPQEFLLYDLKELLLNIHKYLFSNLYEWGGEYRKCDFYKSERVLSGGSVRYASFDQIDLELDNVLSEFEKISKKNINTETVCDSLAALWQVHPFREGNTRTCLLFLWIYLKQIKVDLNYDLIHKHPFYIRDSLVMYCYGETQYLINIMDDALHDKEYTYDDYLTNNEEKYKISKEEYEAFKRKYNLKKNDYDDR